MSPDRAHSRGLTSTVCFPMGNLAPEGSVIKSTAIDPSLVGEDQVLSASGPGPGLCHGRSGDQGDQEPARSSQGDVIVLICGGPSGRGHAGDLSDHRGAQAAAALQACGGAHRCALQRRFHGRLHRPHLARGAGRRTHRQGSGGRPDRDRHRSQDARSDLFNWWATRREPLARKKARACWPSGNRARTCSRIRSCPTIRGCGPRWCRPAAASGAAASTMSTRSLRNWRDPSETLPHQHMGFFVEQDGSYYRVSPSFVGCACHA